MTRTFAEKNAAIWYIQTLKKPFSNWRFKVVTFATKIFSFFDTILFNLHLTRSSNTNFCPHCDITKDIFTHFRYAVQIFDMVFFCNMKQHDAQHTKTNSLNSSNLHNLEKLYLKLHTILSYQILQGILKSSMHFTVTLDSPVQFLHDSAYNAKVTILFKNKTPFACSTHYDLK